MAAMRLAQVHGICENTSARHPPASNGSPMGGPPIGHIITTARFGTINQCNAQRHGKCLSSDSCMSPNDPFAARPGGATCDPSPGNTYLWLVTLKWAIMLNAHSSLAT